MPGKPVRILGLAELISALNEVDRDLAVTLRGELKEVAGVVAKDAAERLAALDPTPAKSAAGIIPRVRSAGLVTVEQKYRKTTGKRPDWGVRQMQDAFLPAADANEDKVASEIEAAIDRVAFSHGF
jgi:hypothetical protein